MLSFTLLSYFLLLFITDICFTVTIFDLRIDWEKIENFNSFKNTYVNVGDKNWNSNPNENFQVLLSYAFIRQKIDRLYFFLFFYLQKLI